MSAMTEMIAESRLLSRGLGDLPSVNLLPPEIAEQVQFRRIQAGLGALVALAAVGVGLLTMNAAASVSHAEERVSAASAEQTRLQAQTRQYDEVTATYEKAAAAQKLLVSAMGPEVRYSRYLHDLSLTIPTNVWLTSVTYAQTPPVPAGTTPAANAPTGLGTVTFAGTAKQHEDVAVWLEALAQQEGFDTPVLQSSTELKIGAVPVVNWTATVPMNNQALSGRFLAGGG
ncbi:MAG: Fimbrial assembly family protein [Frankiales bacterium]|nr:Fimbrial assembly family protein [Frankiales bacterium]